MIQKNVQIDSRNCIKLDDFVGMRRKGIAFAKMKIGFFGACGLVEKGVGIIVAASKSRRCRYRCRAIFP